MAAPTAGGDIGIVDLGTFKTRIVVKGRVRAIVVGKPTPTSTTSSRRTTRSSGTLVDERRHRRHSEDRRPSRRSSIATINCDNARAGLFVEGDATSGGSTEAGPRAVEDREPEHGRARRQGPDDGRAAGREAADDDVHGRPLDGPDKASSWSTTQTDWLNHLQFSPVDPHFLMYCHEGSGWRVDRIWLVRTDGTGNEMIPDEPGRNRILETELAGHEW